jgi:uncharacterized membrane protein YdjX (TVP38/TMEM64 family)
MKKFLVWIAITAVLVFFIYIGLELHESRVLTAHNLRVVLVSMGPLAPFGYIALMIFMVITPMPDALVSVTGGYLFGPLAGGILSMIGLAIGASVNFVLARKLGRKYVNQKFPQSVNLIDTYAAKLGWQTVMLLHMLPSVTFDLIGYAAGLSNMPYPVYIGATILGSVPMLLFTTMLGNSLQLKSWKYIIVVILLGIIGLIVGSVISLYSKNNTLPKNKEPKKMIKSAGP